MSRILELAEELAKSSPEKLIYRYYGKNEPVGISRVAFYHDLKEKRREFLPFSGKTVALSSGNSYGFIITCLGAVSAGCRTALFDTRWDREETFRALERVEACLVLYDEDSEDIFEDLSEKIPGTCGRLITDAVAHSGESERMSASEEENNCPEGDILVFTSGTSGKAKIAVSPAESILGHLRTIKDQAFYEKDEWWIIPVPFFHCFGINMVILSLLRETPLMISSMRYVERDLKQSQAVGLVAVPYLIRHLLDRNGSFGTLKKIITAGGKCPESLALRCREYGVTVQNCYGSSELTSCVAFSRPDESVERLYYHSEIHPMINVEGELVLRTPFHMKGYLDMPEQTEAVLQTDGLHTGDAAFCGEGYFSVMGRISDVIVLENGENLLLAEVEEALNSIPGVKEAAVLVLKNRLTAVFAADGPEAQARMEQYVAEYNAEKPFAQRILDVLIYSGAFPRTSSGKLIRGELKEKLLRNKQ